MKTIFFTEYTYVLHAYTGTIEVSEEDYNKLNEYKVELSEIMDNYDLDYDGESERLEDERFDSIEWEVA